MSYNNNTIITKHHQFFLVIITNKYHKRQTEVFPNFQGTVGLIQVYVLIANICLKVIN